jgi:hypothetical protein
VKSQFPYPLASILNRALNQINNNFLKKYKNNIKNILNV